MFFGGDPFEHFAGMHGGGAGGRPAKKDVDTTKLYETLGVRLRQVPSTNNASDEFSSIFNFFNFYRCRKPRQIQKLRRHTANSP